MPVEAGVYLPQVGLSWQELRARVVLSARERAEQLGEALEVLRLLFTAARPSFTGRHFSLREAPSRPRPLQQPHPPLHVGGAGEKLTLPLVARHADVWNCPTYALADL